MISVTQDLSKIFGDAFNEIGLPEELGTVRVSDRPDLAQFQCNGAMAAAKHAKKAPRAVAEEIVQILSGNKIINTLEIAGPGFINIKVTDAYLQDHLASIRKDDRLGVGKYGNGETVIIDYVGANIAKAMHVGHIRPAIIGDCVKRMIRFAGYNALGDVHMGDWGLPMGQIISEFQLRYPEWPYFNPDFDGEYPAKAPFDYADLETIYPEASSACKEDPERLEIARQATAKLQNGDKGYMALLHHFIDLSKIHIKSNIQQLGIEFEIWKGESDVHCYIEEIANDFRAKNILEKSDGAEIVRVAKDDDKKELPPLIFYKSNGAVTYGTTDIATIYERIQLYKDLARIVYVVDKRQNLHFEQVFRASERAGYTKDGLEFHHIGFGTLNGEDGKPFKTRSGQLPRLDMLLMEAQTKALERINEAGLAQDMDDKDKKEIASHIAKAALKFSDLSNQPHMDYIFDLDRMLSFEGKTGPYLLYQAVRIQSLLRKAKDKDIALSGALTLTDIDRPLVLMLCQWPEIFDLAYQGLSPHYICDYAYTLAQGFSSFYGNCHILTEKDEALRGSRLLLCEMVLTHLTQALSMLGITIPSRM